MFLTVLEIVGYVAALLGCIFFAVMMCCGIYMLVKEVFFDD